MTVDISEYLTRYFEQLEKGNAAKNAKGVRDAAATCGEAPAGGVEAILAHAETVLGIDAKNELAELDAARATAQAEKARRELETEKEKAAETVAKLAAEYPASEPGKRQEIVEGMEREYATLKKTVTAGPKIITSKSLMATQYPPRKWVADGLIGPGLTILSGAPKIGKSWLLFALAEAASEGGNFLSTYGVDETSVLHLSLEDTERSIKERRGILASKQGGYAGNDRLLISTEWETGIAGLETYLRAHTEISLVIIDTLGRFMPSIEDMNDYAPAVKALAGIKRIADTLDIAILVVHHAKKGSNKERGKGDWMDNSLGSQGIVGTVDTIILLQRDIDDKTGERKNTGSLYATGRSIKDVFHKLEYSPQFGMWVVTEKKESPGQGNGAKQTSRKAETGTVDATEYIGGKII